MGVIENVGKYLLVAPTRDRRVKFHAAKKELRHRRGKFRGGRGKDPVASLEDDPVYMKGWNEGFREYIGKP